MGAPDALALDWARRYPDRFIPFAGKEAIRDFILSDGERAWTLKSPAVVAYLREFEAALKAGQFKGIGEINNNDDYNFPADSLLMQRLWSLSATYRVPINVHTYSREGLVAEMERLLASDRRGTWVWAHAGEARPELVFLRSFLRHLKKPNPARPEPRRSMVEGSGIGAGKTSPGRTAHAKLVWAAFMRVPLAPLNGMKVNARFKKGGNTCVPDQ